MNPSTANNPLSQLRDLHLPAPVSWWPLAPGWYILIALGLILLAIFTWHAYKRRQQRRLQQTVLTELHHYLQQQPPAWANINILLKRAAFIHHSRPLIAGLVGETWLAWLDEQTGTHAFTTGEGRILLTGPYQQKAMGNAHIHALLTQTITVLLYAPSQRKPIHLENASEISFSENHAEAN